MTRRPAMFERMGPKFASAFGNVDAVFTIAGVAQPAVRAILRVWRETDLAEEQDQAVEGTTHLLAVPASKAPGLTSQRDSVTIDGATYQVINIDDDARAMLRISLSGDI
ncbi:head-tail joining protein [Ensifer aridi]|uniref:head-tail joining protein n=1 Tax=Ensifer aridi TaxID=1708715 RepID=UPI000478BEC7